jgi:hypothetical protein
MGLILTSLCQKVERKHPIVCTRAGWNKIAGLQLSDSLKLHGLTPRASRYANPYLCLSYVHSHWHQQHSWGCLILSECILSDNYEFHICQMGHLVVLSSEVQCDVIFLAG